MAATPSATARDLPRASEHRAGCGPEAGVPASPRSTRGRWRAAVLVAVHAVIAVRVAHWLATERTLSALEPSEAGHSLAQGVINAGLVFMVLLTLSTLVVGRFFCGWACHLVALQDGAAWLLGRLGLRPRPLRSRLLAWLPAVAALEMFVVPSVLRMVGDGPRPAWQWHLFTDDLWARFPDWPVALATFVVCGFVAVWLLGAKGFCTYACPYGAIFGLADRVAPGRIRVDADACEGCGHCTAVCTSNVVVHREVALFGQVTDPGCMKCMDCVSACPKDALSFGFGSLPPKRPADGRAKPARTFDFSWPEEFLLGSVSLASVWAFRGLYDQVPFLLSLALGGFAGLAAVLGLRLARRVELRFQRSVLVSNGRWTPRGGVAFVASCGFLLLAVHSALVRFSAIEGERLLRTAPGAEPQRTAAIESALVHLERARHLGLLVPKRLHNQLGQAYFGLGREQEAEADLRAAVEADPTMTVAREVLLELLVRQERLAQAAAVLWDQFEAAPPDAAQAAARAPLVVRLVQELPDAVEPRLCIARIQLALGDRDTAITNLERALERFPGEPRLVRLLDEARASEL
ncbi:4Fe-4S binding protein [Engelhardtia mirabilis]|uniref:Electron transport protein YccM n=1 Tax=Engelhardtia mirabilis TaxID=2528011 RepID=A0A518BHX9_9BACT|nr:Putative electron transport protein YccM [Planctomycetes bacterium Pla133]QDV00916.1 Putative electron transport protein YccM [Planctomycetes bacterium Pla86]